MVNVYKIDRKLTDILKEKDFTISTEIIPPRNGAPQEEILKQIQNLTTAGTQFMSVTKGAGGSLRGGSLPIAQLVKEHFHLPVIAHFTCRDLTPEEVENQLMDHHYFGIRNILALRGDPPAGDANWVPNPKSYPYAFQLIEQIRLLNQGQFLERKGFSATSKVHTDFCIGAAAYPDEPHKEIRIDNFIKKIQAGAEYGITQMIYQVDSYSRFLEDIKAGAKQSVSADIKAEVPVLPGLRLLRSRAQAERMKSRFQIPIANELIQKLPEIPEKTALTSLQEDQVLEVFMDLIADFKKAGAPGVHIFVLVDTDISCSLLRKLRTATSQS